MEKIREMAKLRVKRQLNFRMCLDRFWDEKKSSESGDKEEETLYLLCTESWH
jgi:hypothetical protein